MNAKKWRGEGAGTHVARLMEWLKVDLTFTSASGRDTLSAWGRQQGHESLAFSVVEVRNAVTHPKPGQNIYEHDGVLQQAWLLVAFWLQLAILRRIDYRGHASDTADRTRWAGDSDPVPWTVTNDGTVDDDHGGAGGPVAATVDGA